MKRYPLYKDSIEVFKKNKLLPYADGMLKEILSFGK